MESHVVEEKISSPPPHAGAAPAHHDDETIAGRTVAFPENVHVEEKHHHYHHHGITTAKHGGIEMKRTLTQEERELANAGYEHLQQTKAQKAEEENVHKEIHEHKLSVELLRQELGVSFDVKDPARSQGLGQEEAQTRLRTDGPNVLTPPKKKSGLRKVGISLLFYDQSWMLNLERSS